MSRVAVVGAGVAGLSCAWLLSKSTQAVREKRIQGKEFDVVLYESGDYLGGHTNTVTFKNEGKEISVDTGFIVYNNVNYLNLKRFFEEENVKTVDSDMSFALSANGGELEWGSDGFGTLFAQKKNLVSFSFLRLIWEILRFGREAPLILHNAKTYEEMTVREYLESNGYSEYFRDNYILPMTAAVWSTPLAGMLDFPIFTLVHFMHNHYMLQIDNRPRWRTVSGGSKEYVKKIREQLDRTKFDVRLRCPVTKIRREEANGKTNIFVTDKNGKTERFDYVVLATHGDISLQILQDPSPEELSFLSAFKYTKNKAVLHRDASLMPELRKVWSSWNYLRNKSDSKMVLTYWMNRLQPFLPTSLDLFVTLNPPYQPKDKIYEVTYEHPIYLPQCITAQKKLKENQGRKNTFYCGAYTGFGFHEDGFISGLQVAESLGAKCPWKIDTSRYDMRKEHNEAMDFNSKLKIALFFLVVFQSIVMLAILRLVT